ncbi:MAG TPA: DUF4080 domain-containing protein [Mammaliicoccus lentus]|nr:DUF4080 domain-containing protein [Mammaliicoccus lentus]HJF21673.1 DUF4080 domain-containing protein [Mammaliicoccus lentus]
MTSYNSFQFLNVITYFCVMTTPSNFEYFPVLFQYYYETGLLPVFFQLLDCFEFLLLFQKNLKSDKLLFLLVS